MADATEVLKEHIASVNDYCIKNCKLIIERCENRLQGLTKESERWMKKADEAYAQIQAIKTDSPDNEEQLLQSTLTFNTAFQEAAALKREADAMEYRLNLEKGALCALESKVRTA